MSDLRSIETLEALKKAQANPLTGDEAVRKGFTESNSATTGLTYYDLEIGAKTLFPVPTPLRNMLPRLVAGKGIQANWKAFIGIAGGDCFGGVGEAQRGAIVSQTLVEQYAAFKGFGQENFTTFEADYAAEGFDDAKARAVEFALKQTMISEEKAILFGKGLNSSPLGTTATPTLTLGTSGTLAAGVVSVIAVYLTGKGFLSSSVQTGVPVSGTLASADGSQITYTGFNAAPSASATETVPSGGTGSILATVPVARDVMAYAWYAGAVGSERLVAITPTNSLELTALGSGSAQLVSALGTNDNSQDPNCYEGLLTQAARSFNNNPSGYWQALPTGNTGLTSGGPAQIQEIDVALQYFYDTLRMSPTHLFVASEQMRDIKKLLMNEGGNTGAFRFNIDTKQGALVGGAIVISYFNPYAQGTGVQQLEIVLHPYLAPGTMFFYADHVPYPMSNVAEICRVLLRRDYYQIEWPLRTRKYEYGIFFDGCVQHYFPQSMGILTNVGTNA